VGRVITIAAAQLGPVPRDARRGMVVERMLALMEKAARAHATLIVFPELALTTFFPRWAIDDDAALDGFFEAAMPGPETELLFAAARQLRLGLCFGYGELAKQGGRPRRFNSSALIGADGGLIGHYRKVHLPGDHEPQPGFEHQHLEKRYFETGDLGFPVWRAFGGVVGMLICNDRRWPPEFISSWGKHVDFIRFYFETCPYKRVTGLIWLGKLTFKALNTLASSGLMVPTPDMGSDPLMETR
jgi:predicted amidohydrolase